MNTADRSERLIIAYRRELGLEGESEKCKKRREEAFRIAHELRRFEIELIWRRSTYFWGLQIAAFAGVGLIVASINSNSSTQAGMLPWSAIAFSIVVALFGLSGALAWYWTAKASKVWMYNWETHIDFLEDEFTGSLYKTLYFRDNRRRLSLTGVNEAVTLTAVVLWATIVLLMEISALTTLGAGPTFSAVGFVFFNLTIFLFGALIYENFVVSAGAKTMRPIANIELEKVGGQFYRRTTFPNEG